MVVTRCSANYGRLEVAGPASSGQARRDCHGHDSLRATGHPRLRARRELEYKHCPDPRTSSGGLARDASRCAWQRRYRGVAAARAAGDAQGRGRTRVTMGRYRSMLAGQFQHRRSGPARLTGVRERRRGRGSAPRAVAAGEYRPDRSSERHDEPRHVAFRSLSSRHMAALDARRVALPAWCARKQPTGRADRPVGRRSQRGSVSGSLLVREQHVCGQGELVPLGAVVIGPQTLAVQRAIVPI